jgi:hypothetical protein
LKANTGDLSVGFMKSVAAMAARFRMLGADVTGEDILAVMNAESGIKASIAGTNPDGSHDYGLNQLHELTTLRAVGWGGTPDEFLALTAQDQLPYVERYFMKLVQPVSAWKRIAGVRGIYLVNGWPGALGRGIDSRNDAAILGVRGHAGYYPNIDAQGTGANTPAQIPAWVARWQGGARWQEARARYWIESGEAAPRLSPVRVVAAGLVLGVLAGAAVRISRTP